jgi:hypothetical protein
VPVALGRLRFAVPTYIAGQGGSVSWVSMRGTASPCSTSSKISRCWIRLRSSTSDFDCNQRRKKFWLAVMKRRASPTLHETPLRIASNLLPSQCTTASPQAEFHLLRPTIFPPASRPPRQLATLAC